MQHQGILRENSSGLSWIIRLIDSLLISVVQFVALREFGVAWDARQSLVLVLTLLFFGAVSEYHSLYRLRPGERLSPEVGLLAVIWASVAALLLMVAFATKTSESFSRLATSSWFIATPVILIAARIVLRIALRQIHLRSGNQQTVAIVGCTSLADRLLSAIAADPMLSLEFAGIYDDRVEPRQQFVNKLTSKVVGTIDQLIADVQRGKINQVYLALPLRAEDRVSDILHKLADTTATVYYVPDLSTFTLLRARVTSVGHIPAFSIFDSPFKGIDGTLKRMEDLVLGSIALLIAAIPMLLVAVAIKVTTKGPALFKQRRYGLGGREIRVFKFRTMTVAEDGGKVAQASQNDQRVTAIGAILRRTSVDELPQLLNVLGGSMSLVGPRPHAVAHNEQYRAIVGNYMLRHKVKPGITGWAQVNGLRGETEVTDKMRRRVQYDLYYINNWGLLFDIKIMWLTVFGRSTRKNAL
jgi:putative colanic acid biosynthesis UDP-glucose lipid carrier transferase